MTNAQHCELDWSKLNKAEPILDEVETPIDTPGVRVCFTVSASRKKVPSYYEIERVGDLIVYSSDTVEDSKTGLMWALKDNGFDLTWHTAFKYCNNYNGEGYSNWRLPKGEELLDFHSKIPWKQQGNGKLITLTGKFLWSVEKRIAPGTNHFTGAGLFNVQDGKLMFSILGIKFLTELFR